MVVLQVWHNSQEKGDVDNALVWLNKAIYSNPSILIGDVDADAQFAAGKIYEEKGNYVQAIYLWELIANRPLLLRTSGWERDKRACVALARLYANLGYCDKADNWFKKSNFNHKNVGIGETGDNSVMLAKCMLTSKKPITGMIITGTGVDDPDASSGSN